MSENSKRREEGREHFALCEDPMDNHPYNRNSLDFSFKFELFCEGWNEAKANYYAIEQETEDMNLKRAMCPWHTDEYCLGAYDHTMAELGICSEDNCPIIYWAKQ